MLSSTQRVPKELFADVLKKGRVIHTSLFSLRFYINPSSSPARFSVVVSKKTAKTAVRRNYARRKVYSSLRAVSRESSFKEGFVGLFFIKTPLLPIPCKEISTRLVETLKEAGAFKISH